MTTGSFADAEIPEDHIEQVFDIHLASDAADGAHGKTDVLRHQFGLGCGERTL